MMKKKLFVGIATILCITLLFANVVFADDTATGTYSGTGYTLGYTVDADGNATITSCAVSDAAPVAITIPSEITEGENKYTVTAVGDAAFSGASGKVSSVDFPTTLTSIGSKAFSRLGSNFTSFSTAGVAGRLPNIDKLPNDAFSANNCLAVDLVIPSSVKRIEWGAFWSCWAIKSITIENGVEYIGPDAFYEAYNVKEVTLPESVTKFDMSAFGRMKALKSLTVNADELTVTFSSATNNIQTWKPARTNLTDGGAGIGGSADLNYTKFNFASLDALKYFANVCCTNANGFNTEEQKSYFIPNNFIYTGTTDFTADGYKCSGINLVYKGTETVDEVTSAKFAIATTVKGFDDGVEKSEIDFSKGFTDGTNTYAVSAIADSAFAGKTGITSVNFGGDLVSIGASAFKGCTGIKEVILNSGFTTIGASAFQNCTNVGKVHIPATLTSWGGNSFGGCANLYDLTFEPGLKVVGNDFWGCRKIENLVFPASVEKFPYSMLGQSFMKNVYIMGDTLPKSADGSNIGFSNVSDKLYFFVTNQTVKDAVESKWGTEAKFGGCTILSADDDAILKYTSSYRAVDVKKAIIIAKKEVNGTLFAVQYDDDTNAVSVSQTAEVSLVAGQNVMIPIDTARFNKNKPVYMYLFENESLKPLTASRLELEAGALTVWNG